MNEIWKTIPGFLDYEASTLGRIRSIDKVLTRSRRDGSLYTVRYKGRVLRARDNNGYLVIDLKDTTKLVHRLVCETFLGSFSKALQVNHINAVRSDNRLCNLEMCTPQENSDHAERLLLRKKTPQGAPVLTPQERETINFFFVKQKGPGSFVSKSLAKIFKVSIVTVNRISKESHA